MRIAGTGCSVVDLLYASVDFGSEAFERLRTRRPGDGGLAPGRLVFLEEFEAFAGCSGLEAVRALVGDKAPDTVNIGGPSLVALILAAQVLADRRVGVEFHGARGGDDFGRLIYDRAGSTPLDVSHFGVFEGPTPYTLVLSDPNFDAGHGERCFVNCIGPAWHFGPANIPESFFDADIVEFGGTALVPGIHDHLGSLLRKARQRGAVTVVNTVFDFRSEKAHPGQRWPLGEDDETCHSIDLLVMDMEEALRLSGASVLTEACAFFQARGVSSLAITHGPNPVTFWSDGRLFRPCDPMSLPICAGVGEWIESHPDARGDTTGCGDNFAGGMLSSLAAQMMERPVGSLDMAQAVAAGVCAGGCACFHIGGVLVERRPGEKKSLIEEMYARYRCQVAGQCELPAHPF